MTVGLDNLGSPVLETRVVIDFIVSFKGLNSNQRTNGPVNAHLISRPSKEQNIQNLENIW